MSISEQEWQQEQERVDRVVDLISKRIDTLQELAGETRAEIVEYRKNFWDDVRLNLDDLGEAGETSVTLKQQSEILNERERTLRHAEKEYDKLRRLRQTPYFGRIDFAETGEPKKDIIYIGIGSFLDEETDEFLVYDWRAPVSSLYYDYGTGPAEFTAPGGTVAGEIELKRQYMIRSGKIRNLFDTGVTIGDELLQEVLGNQHSDSQMKSIVATIQREQNLIIRNERSRLLIVQGAAGSGKTSAALQRVAYLLYRFREMLSADQIILFSPNPMFNSYVSTVLPELGEENMQQTTFQDYLEHRLGKTFELEDPFTQMEYTLTAMQEPGYAARIEGIRYKAGIDFMEVIERYADYLGREGMKFRNVNFQGEVYLSAKHIRERYLALEPHLSIPNKMRLLRDALLADLEARAVEDREKPWVEEEIELLSDETLLGVHNRLKKEKRYTENSFDYYDREKEILADMVIRKRYKPMFRRIRQLRFVDVTGMYRALFADPKLAERFATASGLPEQWAAICAQTAEKIERGELAYEDATPYLDLKERIEGFETNTLIRHVFLDEAQDYSPFQMAFIKRLFPRSKMTVLGDLNQAIYAHTEGNVNGFAKLATLYEGEETETIILRRSYRSTRPIIELTRDLIPGGEQIEPFNRDGRLPTVTRVGDLAELRAKIVRRIAELQEAGHQTTAIICKTAEESQAAYDALKDDIEVRLIKKETVRFEPGVLIIPSYLAKGMEFDAVILYNASKEQYGRESERKLFYTACTRAMHELHLYYVGTMSPLLAGVAAGAYVAE